MPSPGSFPDKVRGVLNEGGLFAERDGWHLPGFPTNSSSANFTSRDLSAGLPSGGAGVGFFPTTVTLDVPQGLDAAFSFEFDGGAQHTGAPYRALLFVNGWKFGKVRRAVSCSVDMRADCTHCSASEISGHKHVSPFRLGYSTTMGPSAYA